HVLAYKNVVYQQLYPDIDLHVYSEASSLKYDLVVNPGADVSAVRLAYNSTSGLEIKKGNLVIHTSIGDVIEQAPVAYQYINNERISVPVSYQLKKGVIGFKVGKEYDAGYPLIIDPNYIFSTFTGSRADNWGFTATYDAQGYFYAGGIVAGNGYPVTMGAVQSSYGGGTTQGIPGDIGISKFTPDGTKLVYATYVGGNGLDEPHSLIVDSQNQLVMSGRTHSTNFPGKTLVGPRGDWDIIMVKLNATATAMVGSMVIGGSGQDGVNINPEGGSVNTTARNYGDGARSEVLLDGAGFIYLASCTSSSNFPVSGGFQSTLGGKQDGVVLKINPTCSGIVWSSYLGGSDDDAAFVLAIPDLKSIYVGGATASSNFRTVGTVISSAFRGGATDGFVAHIAADGSSILQSTFLGSDNGAADMLYGLQMDDNGYLYAMGTTEGNWPIRQPPGTATFYNDNSKQFIVKLKPDLSDYVYSTTFGKKANTPSISPVAFLVDRCENVYVSGWGGDRTVGGIDAGFPNSNTTGLPLKSPLQGTTDGKDFYFFVLQRDARSMLFGSYFGGNGLFEHVDGGTSRFDRNGIIYQAICAACNVNPPQPRFPTTPGAYAPTKDPSPNVDCNLAALKISFNLDGIKAGIASIGRKSHFCLGDPITFVDTTQTIAQSWSWNFGDGSPDITGTQDTVEHVYTKNGDYTVRLIKYDPSACNLYDTAYYNVRVRADKALVSGLASRQPPCGSLTYRFDNLSEAPANQPFTGASFTWDFGDGSPLVTTDTTHQMHSYAQEGVYNVLLSLVDTNYCNTPEVDTIPLRVAANVAASYVAPDSGCAPLTVDFNNTSRGGLSFFWDFGNGVTSTAAYPTTTYLKPGVYTVKMIAYDSTTCNGIDSTTSTITVASPPAAGFSFAPGIAQVNTPTKFTNSSSPDAVQFLWSFGDGQLSAEESPEHQYNTTGTYDVCLTVTNATGCQDTLCQKVSAIVVPLFDVPSAFSPNGDGRNDVFLVKAFGVDHFEMKIFNRQGLLVFQSNDPQIGWDGKYKGAEQPMDAYAYEVTLVFTDGTKANKAGSVTLLR
ncbi:MAG TPA: PKD domain-containing protein, partial [Chitinophaga sp.]